jgi:gluconolactonase
VKLDSALDALVSSNARLELLKGDYFGLAEGPVWVPEGQSGYLLFSDIGANRIYKWSLDRKLSVFLEKSGFNGPDSPWIGSVFNSGRINIVDYGSNGLGVDPQGRVVLCAQGDRAIVRIEKDGSRTTLVDRFEGKRINGPNDLTVKSDGSVYFTDMGAALRGEFRGKDNPMKELPFEAVFKWKEEKVERLTMENLGGLPNGITFSPDEKTLYVTAGPRILRYDVQPDGTIANRRVFVEMSSDGIKADQRGNVWGAGPDGVRVFSSEGKHLGTIPAPQNATNLAFGDADRKTLYVTTNTGLWRVRVNVDGFTPTTTKGRSALFTPSRAERQRASTFRRLRLP